MGGSETIQRTHIMVLLACVAGALLVFRSPHAAPVAPPATAPRAREPLDFVPAGAALVATVDLERVRRSRLGAMLAGSGRELPGVGRLRDVCGFDPTEQVKELVVAVPRSAGDGPPDFGVIALGDFRADRIAECARAVIGKRGGEAVSTRLGSFTSVRDKSRAGGEIATRNGGPTLLAGGEYLRDLVDVADGTSPALDHDDALHAALRESVDPHSAVIASCVLPPDWLENALGTAVVRASPLSRVRAMAVGVDVSPRVQLHAVVGCDNRDACRDIGDMLDQLRRVELDAWLHRELQTDLAQRIKIESAEKEVSAHVDLAPEEALALVEHLANR